MASAGNVFNTLGKVSLTVNLVFVGLMLASLVAMAAWTPVHYVRSRDDPVPARLGDTARQLAGTLVAVAVVGLLWWAMYSSLRSQSGFARRLRQFFGVTLIL